MNQMLKRILVFIILFSASYSNLAQASYKNAITALHNEDSKAMLIAVKSAIKNKDDDFMNVFVAQLQYKNKSKLNSNVQVESPSHNKQKQSSLLGFMSNKEITELISLLSKRLNKVARDDVYFETRAALILLKAALSREIYNNPISYIKLYNAWRALALEAKAEEYTSPITSGIGEMTFALCDQIKSANKLECLKLAAALGMGYAQSDLGHLYLGEQDRSRYIIFRMHVNRTLLDKIKVNKKLGYYWLNKSIEALDFPYTSNANCTLGRMYQFGLDGQNKNLKQAYLLYLMGVLGRESYGGDKCSIAGLVSMFEDGSIEKVAPEYYQKYINEYSNTKNYKSFISSSPQKIVSFEKPEIAKRKGYADNGIVLVIKDHVIPSRSDFSGGEIYIYADGLIVIKKGILTLDKWSVATRDVEKVLEAFSQPFFIKSPIYIGSYHGNVSRYGQLVINAKSLKKAIHFRNHSTPNKVFEVLNKYIPNPHISILNGKFYGIDINLSYQKK